MKKVLYILIGMLLIGGLGSSLQGMEDVSEQKNGIPARAKETAENIINELGNISIWKLGKVKNLLPFAIFAFCLNNYLKQLFVISVVLLVWYLYKSEKGNEWLQKFKSIAKKAIGLSDELPTTCNEECVIDLPVNNQQSDKQDQSIINDNSVAVS